MTLSDPIPLPPPSVARMLAQITGRQGYGPVARKSSPFLGGNCDSSASFATTHTALLTVTPAFMEALKSIAPRRPQSKIPHVVIVAVLGVFAVLVGDASVREFGMAKGSEIAARLNHAPAVSVALVVAAPSAPVARVINAAPVVVATGAATEPVVVTPAVTAPRKTSKSVQFRRPRGALVRQPGQNHSPLLAAQISSGAR